MPRRRPSAVGEETPTLGFGQAAPDAVRFVHAQRELEALGLHETLRADRLGLRLARLSRVAPLRHRRWEEQRGLRTSARGLQMPGFVNDAERHALLHPLRHPDDAERIPGSEPETNG